MSTIFSRRHAIARVATGFVGLTLAATPFHFASASGPVLADISSEHTQMANNLELVAQYAKQVEQYATQLKQWQNQITNTLNVPMQVWSSIQSDLLGVMNVVKQGEALAFSMRNIGEQFKKKFPGYKPTKDFIADYKMWSQTLRDTLKGTLEAANLQSQQFSTEEGVISQLRIMSQSNKGRLQALQTGNQIAVEVAAQLQKLRALSMAQMQTQNAYIAKKEQEKDTMEATIDSLLHRGDIRTGKTYKVY